MLGLLLALLQSVSIGSIVILEQGPTGLSFPFYINEYGADLTYQRRLQTLMYSQPSVIAAMTASGDVYHVSGTSLFRNDQQFGEPFAEPVRSIVLMASGDLIVHSRSKLIRMDSRGSPRTSIEFDGTDFDVDRDQCAVLFSQSDRLGTFNMCEGSPSIRLLPLRPPGEFFGVRFLPDETILAASRDVIFQLERDGSVIRRFQPNFAGPLSVFLDPTGSSFIAASLHDGKQLLRFDSDGLHSATIHDGLSISSVAIRGEWRAALNPLPRRHPSR